MTSLSPTKTKVIINGVDVTTYVRDWSYDVAYNKSYISGINLTLIDQVKDILSIDEIDLLNINNTIEVYRGVVTADEILFKGVIANINYERRLIGLTCYDPLYLAKKKTVTYSFDKDIDPEAGVISDIFINLINRVGLTVDSSSVQNSGTINVISKFLCRAESVFDKCKDLAEAIGWIFFYNPEDEKIYFQPKGFLDNSYIINAKTNVTMPITWKVNEEEQYNSLELLGAEKDVSTVETGRIGTTPGYTTSSITLKHKPVSARILCDASTPPTTERTIGVRNQDVGFEAYFDETKNQIGWNTSVYTPGASDYVIVEYVYQKQVPVAYTDIDSVETYGIKNKTIIRNDLLEVKDAELYAIEFINDYKNPIKSSTINVVDIPNLAAGQRIQVIDDEKNINDFFYITRVRKRYPYLPDLVDVTSTIQDEDNYMVFMTKKLRELDRRGKDSFDSLIHSYSLYNNIIYENDYYAIYKNGDLIFRSNNYDTYIEEFNNTDLKNSSTTGLWTSDFNFGKAYLFSDDVLISNSFAVNDLSIPNNFYLKATITINGDLLDEYLKFYIGEDNNSTINYSEVTLSGTNLRKEGAILLTGSNKYGLNWKAEKTDDTGYLFTRQSFDTLPITDESARKVFFNDIGYLFVYYNYSHTICIFDSNKDFELIQTITLPNIEDVFIQKKGDYFIYYGEQFSTTFERGYVFYKRVGDVYEPYLPDMTDLRSMSVSPIVFSINDYIYSGANRTIYDVSKEPFVVYQTFDFSASATASVTPVFFDNDNYMLLTNKELRKNIPNLMLYKKGATDFEELPLSFSVDDGTVTSISGDDITDNTKSWTTDEFADKTIYIYDGTGKGSCATIVSNTSDTLSVVYDRYSYPTAPTAGSDYAILDTPFIRGSSSHSSIFTTISNDNKYLVVSGYMYDGTGSPANVVSVVYKRTGDKFERITTNLPVMERFLYGSGYYYRIINSMDFTPDDKYLVVCMENIDNNTTYFNYRCFEFNKDTEQFTEVYNLFDNVSVQASSNTRRYRKFVMSSDFKYLAWNESPLSGTVPTYGPVILNKRDVKIIDNITIKYEVL